MRCESLGVIDITAVGYYLMNWS